MYKEAVELLYKTLTSDKDIMSIFPNVTYAPQYDMEVPALVFEVYNLQKVDYVGYGELSFIFYIITSSKAEGLSALFFLQRKLHKQLLRNDKVAFQLVFSGNLSESYIFDLRVNILSSLWTMKIVQIEQ